MRRLMLVFAAAAASAPAAGWAAQSQAPGQTQGAAAQGGAARQCFFTRDWRGWRAVDRNALHARIGVNRVVRIEFDRGCPGLTSAGARLVTSSVTGQVCSPLDLDVRVSNPPGFATPCIVSKITHLTPAEIAALPRNQVP